MRSILERASRFVRVFRYERQEHKTALVAAVCITVIILLSQLPLEFSYRGAVSWMLASIAAFSVVLTLWRVRRYTLAPPRQKQILGVTAIKGAGAFTPEDAVLFSKLGRLEELRQIRSLILDDELPMVAVMGESGAGKTSFLRAGLTFILSATDKQIPIVYWEADPVDSRESFLNTFEVQLGIGYFNNISRIVIAVDQLEQLDLERDFEFFELLRHYLENNPPFMITWILAFRREFAATWLEFLGDLPKRYRHRLKTLTLRNFTIKQAKEIFATLAEEANLSVQESLMEEALNQLLKGKMISPVDLGITLQVLHRQSDLAVDTTSFHFSGGHLGLLTLYLEMILEPYPPTLREEVLRALVALVDQENARRVAGGLHLAELRARIEPKMLRHFELALERLAQSNVRVLEIVNETPGRYRLIHERFIPVVRRLAATLLDAADDASRLLERRFRLWEHEKTHRSRFLLRGSELQKIQEQQVYLHWGASREAKSRFLKASRRRLLWRRCLGVAIVLIGVSGAVLVTLQQQVRETQKEMFEWGLPKGTYDLLPRVTCLSVPSVTNLRWLSRAENLEELAAVLAPQYTVERNQYWPKSLKKLVLSTSNLSNLQSLPSNLQQLTIEVWGGKELSWPEFPADLRQLTVDMGTYDWEASSLRDFRGLPGFPSSLQQLTVKIFSAGAASLPEFPSGLQRLSLDISELEVMSLPEFPSTLQWLAINMPDLKVSSLPELPLALRRLELRVSVSETSNLPRFPPNLESLDLDVSDLGVANFPEFPATLRRLTLKGLNSGEFSLLEFPPALEQLTLDVSRGVSSWPELPLTLKELTLSASNRDGVTSLPALPLTLVRLNLDFLGSEVSSLPNLPPSLEQLKLNINSESRVSSWPRLPSNLKHLTLNLSHKGLFGHPEVSSLPALPFSLRQLSLKSFGFDVARLPEFPETLRGLSIRVRPLEKLILPEFPSALQELELELLGPIQFGAFPATLRRFTLLAWDADVQNLSAVLPNSVRCLALEVSLGSSIVLEGLPDSLEEIKLGVGREFSRYSYSCQASSN